MSFDISQFIDQFRDEARDRVRKLNQGLVELEKNPDQIDLLREMMRQAHSIKGTSTMMGFKLVADLAHRIEDGLQKVIEEGLELTGKRFNLLFQGLDLINRWVEEYPDKGEPEDSERELVFNLEQVFADGRKGGEDTPVKTSPLARKHGGDEEAVLSPTEPSVPVEDRFVRVDTVKLDRLMNLSGELMISRMRMERLVETFSEKARLIDAPGENLPALAEKMADLDAGLGSLVSELQTEVMEARVVPISALFNYFPRAMRDLAAEKGKKINLEIKGQETGLDKGIIDQLRDPLMHILRNAVDHGIESPELRRKRGKAEEAKVVLSAYQKGRRVIITVTDDGSGIDIAAVVNRAIDRGLISEEAVEEMFDKDKIDFIFLPGFSTSDEVGLVSGRGVGLDVVREMVVRLKGMVSVESEPGKGTSFIIEIPITLAVTESLLVSVGVEVFVIPADSVIETIRIMPDDIKTVESREVTEFSGEILPLTRLHRLFNLSRRGIIEKKYQPVIVVGSLKQKMGLLIDELRGEEKIIQKSIGPPLSSIPDIGGATILGDGRVALILDIPSIIRPSRRLSDIRSLDAIISGPVKKRMKTILLVEDALTTAILEKNILESVGYSVVVARDGNEALKKASQEKFDLVITDILMPGMDGFELIERLKSDNLFRKIPIIIVTTLGRDKDKRKGMEAGADAYILKSEFTSDVLLETIERLI